MRHYFQYYSKLLLFSVLVCLFIFVPWKTISQTCLEECKKNREDLLKKYQDCLLEAEKISDSFRKIKKKKHCRDVYALPDCNGLTLCKDEKNESKEKVEILSIGEMKLSNSDDPNHNEQKKFKVGQSIWVHFPVKVGVQKVSKFWFDQDLTIYDQQGTVVFTDEQSFKREGEMISVYHFKTSFVVPQKFKKGNYRLVLTLRERFLSWEGERETTLSIF